MHTIQCTVYTTQCTVYTRRGVPVPLIGEPTPDTHSPLSLSQHCFHTVVKLFNMRQRMLSNPGKWEPQKAFWLPTSSSVPLIKFLSKTQRVKSGTWNQQHLEQIKESVSSSKRDLPTFGVCLVFWPIQRKPFISLPSLANFTRPAPAPQLLNKNMQ